MGRRRRRWSWRPQCWRARLCRQLRFLAPAASSRPDAGESRQRLTATPTLPLQLPVRGVTLLVPVHERDGAALLVPRHGSATQLQLSLRDDPELLAETLTTLATDYMKSAVGEYPEYSDKYQVL